MNERNAELAVRESPDVHAIRLRIDPVYERMVERMNAQLVMDMAKPAVIKFVEQHNEKIKYYNTTLATRGNRGKTKEKPAKEN